MEPRTLYSWQLNGPGVFFCSNILNSPGRIDLPPLPLYLTGYVEINGHFHHYRTSEIVELKYCNIFMRAVTQSSNQYDLYYDKRRTVEPRATIEDPIIRIGGRFVPTNRIFTQNIGQLMSNLSITGKICNLADDTPENDVQIAKKEDRFYAIESPCGYRKTDQGVRIFDTYGEYYLINPTK